MADGYYEFWSSPKTALAIQIVSFPLFLIFIRPLYQFAKSRNPMLLLYSKSIGMAIVLFYTPIGQALAIFSITPSWWRYVLYMNYVPFIAVRLHLLAMALNRFFSVYAPFKYHRMKKRAILIKICTALWLTAIIFTLASLYAEFNQIATFPVILLFRGNIEQICIYSACLFYVIMAAKLIWIRFHTYGALQGSVMEKDYYKISTVCIVSVLPFLFGLLSLRLMQTFIATGIYNRNYWLQDILITFNIPFLLVANFSEEICLLILSSDFRALFKANLLQNAASFLKAITFGQFKMESMNSVNNENDLLNTNINGTNTITNNGVVSKCRMLQKIGRNNRVGMAPVI